VTVPTGLTNAAMAGYLSCLVMRQNPRHAAPGLNHRVGNQAIVEPKNPLSQKLTDRTKFDVGRMTDERAN
jgi:hypothetical protein